ncbi:MAG: DMT family transporter [Pseudomonadota bacterium]
MIASQTSPLRGIALKVAAITIFTAMMSLIKATSDSVPPGEAVFFRAVFSLPVLFVWLTWRGELATGLRTGRPLGHVLRGVMGSMAMGLRFFALGVLNFSEVTAIGFASPLLLVVFAALFLGERVRAFRIMTVLIGLIGVLIVLWPRLDFDQVAGGLETMAALAMLVSASTAALAQVFVRKLVATETTAAIVFYFALTTAGLSLLTAPFSWVMPTWDVAALLVMAGLLGGIGQICLTTCYRHADASVVAPFDYLAMLLALWIGYFAFDETPTGTMLVGAGIVILAGVLIIWREHVLGLRRRASRAVSNPTQT